MLLTGRVDVHVNSTEQRDHFLIHTKYLDIDSARLFRGSSKSDRNEVDLLEAMEYQRNEFFVLRTNGAVGPDQYVMSFGENEHPLTSRNVY